uniref:MerR family transcriptional regulator n=1 Tax=Trichocoleus desertorum TaxID=1481672 RepID=UPI0025B446F1|nr:MerR family transcriptional regulator [Trichocoleus desertorum]
MQERFFTSKQASEITGCTLRQLQYWREKEVVVPTISGTGTGRSIYYAENDLVALAVMEYLLGLGFNFELCREKLKELQKEEQGFFSSPLTEAPMSRYMLWRPEPHVGLKLGKYNLDLALKMLEKGQPVVPFWLDLIQQELVEAMQKLGSGLFAS